MIAEFNVCLQSADCQTWNEIRTRHEYLTNRFDGCSESYDKAEVRFAIAPESGFPTAVIRIESIGVEHAFVLAEALGLRFAQAYVAVYFADGSEDFPEGAEGWRVRVESGDSSTSGFDLNKFVRY